MDVSRYREIPVLDETQWSALLDAGDDDPRALLDELIALFRADVEERLHPLAEADPVRDHADVRQHAHSIAGSGANLGASRLAAIARRLEKGEDISAHGFARTVAELQDTYAESLRLLRERVEGL